MQADKQSAQESEPTIVRELRELVQKAKAGDASVVSRIRQILDEHPVVWQHMGNVARLAQEAWVHLLAGSDPLTAESIRRKAAEMRDELSGENPTPTEKLLAENVVSAWLETEHARIALADVSGSSLPKANYWLKRAELADKKYHAALKLLTTLRAKLPEGLAPLNAVRLHDPERQRA